MSLNLAKDSTLRILDLLIFLVSFRQGQLEVTTVAFYFRVPRHHES